MHEIALLLQNLDPDDARKIAAVMLAVIPVIILIAIAILMIPCWFICKKAGFSPWLSLLCLLAGPGLLVLLYILAFAQWKVVPAPQMVWTPQPPMPPNYPPQPPLPPRA